LTSLERHVAAVRRRLDDVDRTSTIRVLARWEAHPDSSISSIQVIRDPPSILTAAADGSVKVWRMDGKSLGAIVPSRRETALVRLGLARPPEWSFRLD